MGDSMTFVVRGTVSMLPRSFGRVTIILAAMIALACREFTATAPPPLRFNVQIPLPDTLTVTDTASFDVSVRDESGHQVTRATIIAQSSDTSVMSVTPNRIEVDDAAHFVITAHRGGTAEISLAVEGGTGRIEVQGFRDTVVVNERWMSVSVGNGRACGVTANAAAFCWGDGRNGLGEGSIRSSSRPVQVLTRVPVTSVSVGPSHACITDDQALAYCWGRNLMGEVGDGTQFLRVVPTVVAAGTTFLTLTAGDGFTCGISVPGPSYCWGEVDFGELGNGNVTGDASCFFEVQHCVPKPTVAVQADSRFIFSPLQTEVCVIDQFRCDLALRTISTSFPFACGLTASGKVFCWGGDQFVGGPLLGPSCTLSIPCSSWATLAVGAVDFAAGTYSGPVFVAVSAGGQACALEQGGRPWCWGRDNSTPTPLATPLRFASISVGFTHICALTAEGTAYCWGTNEFGQLGTGSTGPATSVPVPVTGQRAYASIAAGTLSTCAVSVAGPLYCWGKGEFGRIGNGETQNVASPTRVLEPKR
jgi:alpha-tubulin suppressor-like RCC1 family protein